MGISTFRGGCLGDLRFRVVAAAVEEAEEEEDEGDGEEKRFIFSPLLLLY